MTYSSFLDSKKLLGIDDDAVTRITMESSLTNRLCALWSLRIGTQHRASETLRIATEQADQRVTGS